MTPDAPHLTDDDAPLPRRGGVVVRRSALIAGACLAALTVAWAGATTWYICAKDELAQGFFARQTEMRFAYEDRIGALSDRLEREVTQNLVDRDTSEARLKALAARQAEIEARQTWLSGLAQRAAGLGEPGPLSTGSIGFLPPSPGSGANRPPARADAKPAPLPAPLADPFSLRLGETGAEKPAPRDRLSMIERSLDAAAADELRVAGVISRAAATRLGRLRDALDATGLDIERRISAAPASIGGPFVAMPDSAKSGPFGHLAGQIEFGLAEIDRLGQAARRLPLGRPLAGELDQTSPFGARVDPFTRGLAFHTGVDFRDEAGASVRATGAGRVIAAEYAGGYGNMVEVDHGGGVTTRYGHLSAFLVTPGERVEAGQSVGRVGSTGRSTGNHVHYETRVNGEPVNPTRFLQAGRLLDAGDRAAFASLR